jgi:hypothetical protein
MAQAVEATTRYAWKDDHPYPECFVCGPQNVEGLRLFPGPVPSRNLAAAPWVVPSDLVDHSGRALTELMWSALDCPSWFGHTAVHPHPGNVLLGRLTAQVVRRPKAGDPCIVIGFPVEKEGRKIHTGSAVFSDDGELLGHARAVWLEVAGR